MNLLNESKEEKLNEWLMKFNWTSAAQWKRWMKRRTKPPTVARQAKGKESSKTIQSSTQKRSVDWLNWNCFLFLRRTTLLLFQLSLTFSSSITKAKSGLLWFDWLKKSSSLSLFVGYGWGPALLQRQHSLPEDNLFLQFSFLAFNNQLKEKKLIELISEEWRREMMGELESKHITNNPLIWRMKFFNWRGNEEERTANPFHFNQIKLNSFHLILFHEMEEN